MDSRTSFLFAEPSFVEGIARLVDFSAALNVYNQSSTPEAADARALRADWEAIGDDLRAATEQVRREYEVGETAR